MKELSIEQKVKACDSNYKVYTELINRLENVKEAIKKQNYGIAMDVLCKPYPEFQVTTHSELKGSEDEDIKHFLVDFIKVCRWTEKKDQGWPSREKCIAWLEKQGEHANFRNKIQVGDKVTRNENGVLVNLSQLKRIAKPAENKGKNNMGISEATKQKLEDNLHKTLEKETPESWNKFLDEQGEQKPFGKRDECLNCQFNYAGECKGFCAMKRSNRKPHKSVDKIEPKFHEGDWVVSPNGVYWHIDKISNNRYEVTSDTGASSNWPLDTNIYHSFSIQDVKDGDVLCSNQVIVLFKQWENNTDYCYIIAHAGIDIIGVLQITDGHWLISNKSKPATKEQRDLLFQKIKEAGYEWDAENKQLRKIEPRQEELTEFEKAVKQVMEEAIECGDTHNLKADADMLLRLVQKSSWSEEDERMYRGLHNLIYSTPYCDSRKELSDWFKSLKERYAWKPSDEQMDALNDVISSRDIKYDVLSELWKDLKKLKG